MKKVDSDECLVGFGAFLREGRESRGMYQREVAKLVGISQAYYNYIEQGKRTVDFPLAIKLCQALRLDLRDYIKSYM